MTNIKELLNRKEKELEEISPWPWKMSNADHDEDFINGEYLDDANGHIINSCFDSHEERDRKFIFYSPQDTSTLIEFAKDCIENLLPSHDDKDKGIEYQYEAHVKAEEFKKRWGL